VHLAGDVRPQWDAGDVFAFGFAFAEQRPKPWRRNFEVKLEREPAVRL